VAMAPTDGLDLDQLAACGDAALYQAKRIKRGTVRFWQAPKPLMQGAA
jgi:predicted signal transduction protein with EAL and GGDEF domain